MGLVIKFTKNQQKYKPVTIHVVHNGETLHLQASTYGNIIQIHFEGPKSFKLHRSDYEKEKVNDISGK